MKTWSNRYISGKGFYKRANGDQIQHASSKSLNASKESPELNSSIELKLRATATTPGQSILYRKENEDQIQYETINSLNEMTHLN
jgi:hypothetical protein